MMLTQGGCIVNVEIVGIDREAEHFLRIHKGFYDGVLKSRRSHYHLPLILFSCCRSVDCSEINESKRQLWVYSATQSICMDWGAVGHAKPELHHVCWVRSRVIGTLGISEELVTVPQTAPSNV